MLMVTLSDGPLGSLHVIQRKTDETEGSESLGPKTTCRLTEA